MAKTIRSYPTSPFILPKPICGTTLIFSRFGPKMDLRFFHFPTSLQVKRLAPKGKKMRMDHPFILGFCQNVTFYIVFPIIFSCFWKKHFSEVTVIVQSFGVSPIQKWEIPDYYYYFRIELLFQNYNLIPKVYPYSILVGLAPLHSF